MDSNILLVFILIILCKSLDNY